MPWHGSTPRFSWASRISGDVINYYLSQLEGQTEKGFVKCENRGEPEYIRNVMVLIVLLGIIFVIFWILFSIPVAICVTFIAFIILVMWPSFAEEDSGEVISDERAIKTSKKPRRRRRKAFTAKNYVFNEFISLDIETTGLDPNQNAIIEVAALKVLNGKVFEKFDTLVNPEIKIPKKITDITGITNEMVKDSPTIRQVMPQLISFLEDYPLIAHNSDFDINFLEANAERCGLEYKSANVIDTLYLSRKAFPYLDNHRLPTLINHLKIKDITSHRASYDAVAAVNVYLKCIETLRPQFK